MPIIAMYCTLLIILYTHTHTHTHTSAHVYAHIRDIDNTDEIYAITIYTTRVDRTTTTFFLARLTTCRHIGKYLLPMLWSSSPVSRIMVGSRVIPVCYAFSILESSSNVPPPPCYHISKTYYRSQTCEACTIATKRLPNILYVVFYIVFLLPNKYVAVPTPHDASVCRTRVPIQTGYLISRYTHLLIHSYIRIHLSSVTPPILFIAICRL